MAINSIKTFAGALDTINSQPLLCIDTKTGELNALGGIAKFRLLLQNAVLRKFPAPCKKPGVGSSL
jgi:hypothetical protein